MEDTSYRVAKEELQSFIDRIENIEKQMDEYKEARKEIYAESKGRGYDNKVVRKIISDRRRDSQVISEEESILTLYREALDINI